MATQRLTVHKLKSAVALSSGASHWVNCDAEEARTQIYDSRGTSADTQLRGDLAGSQKIDGVIYCRSREQAEALAAAINMTAPTAELAKAEEAA
ncbi:MAG: hypothetical protein AAF416_15530 [Pseudomonadota bacterium]